MAEVGLIAVSWWQGDIPKLATAPPAALASFALSAAFHFGGGWTLLALSQQRVGVARTGAVVSLAPLVGTLGAALLLDEPLTAFVLLGVVIVVVGVALLSFSGAKGEERRWLTPWHALLVAFLWGASPLLIRYGLSGLDAPVLGLAVGIGTTVIIYGVGLAIWRRHLAPPQRGAWPFVVLGGLTGAVAIGAQWISFGLTTIAIALSVQQLAALVVVALVPLTFQEPFERLNLLLVTGTLAIVSGTVLVVLAGTNT